jgi:steroid delta-isomerase-like uncharacterized protein
MPAAADTTAIPRAELEELIGRYFGAWGERDADAIVALHSPDGVFHLHAGSDPVTGREAIRATFAALLTQWPDLGFDQRLLILHDSGWVVEWTMRGTLAEPFELEGTAIGKPGARMEVDALDLVDVENGLVKAKHTFVDSVTLLRQLGTPQ